MAAHITEIALQHDTRPSTAAPVAVRPLPRSVALLTIVGLSGGLWFGLYRLALWLF